MKRYLIVAIVLILSTVITSCSASQGQNVSSSSTGYGAEDNSFQYEDYFKKEDSACAAGSSFSVKDNESSSEQNKSKATSTENKTWTFHSLWLEKESLQGFNLTNFGYNCCDQIWAFFKSESASKLVLYDLKRKDFLLEKDLPLTECIKGQNREIILYSDKQQTFYFYNDSSFNLNRSIQLSNANLVMNDTSFNYIDISPDNTKLLYANPLLHVWDLNSQTLLYETEVEYGQSLSGMFVDNNSVVANVFRPLQDYEGVDTEYTEVVYIDYKNKLERVLDTSYCDLIVTSNRVYLHYYHENEYKISYYPIDGIYDVALTLGPMHTYLAAGGAGSRFFLNADKTFLLELYTDFDYTEQKAMLKMLDLSKEDKFIGYPIRNMGYISCAVSNSGDIFYCEQKGINNELLGVYSTESQ